MARATSLPVPPRPARESSTGWRRLNNQVEHLPHLRALPDDVRELVALLIFCRRFRFSRTSRRPSIADHDEHSSFLKGFDVVEWPSSPRSRSRPTRTR